jgi:hypothetical protein
MGSMQCNVKFGYQLSICSGTKENHVNLDRIVCPYCLAELVCVLKITNGFCRWEGVRNMQELCCFWDGVK